MRPLSLFRTSRHSLGAFKIFQASARQSSTALEALQSSLYEQLTTRPPNVIYDYLSPTPSHLLNISLADFVPQNCWPKIFRNLAFNLGCGSGSRLPQGHHLVYFPPQVPSSGLLPDGTDSLQSPGSPFDNRMWAGGTVWFDTEPEVQLRTDKERACCTETITDVTVKGTKGDEKVFVTIQRQIGSMKRRHPKPNFQLQNPGIKYPVTIVEERNIVYFRENAPATGKVPKPDKILLPTHEPDFSFTLIPTSTLLFRFSALTFNAHAIHLDPQYCREVEGKRNLLVHGPLTLVLMLSALSSQLQEANADVRRELVKSFTYRNLVPLYVGEEMKVCVRRDLTREGKVDVWIEGSGGGYAVKGTALVGR